MDRLKQLNKVFLYFITTSQSQRFLISTKQDTEHMHQSCQSGYNMEKVKLRFCCLTITKKKDVTKKRLENQTHKNQALLHNWKMTSLIQFCLFNLIVLSSTIYQQSIWKRRFYSKLWNISWNMEECLWFLFILSWRIICCDILQRCFNFIIKRRQQNTQN